MNWIYLAVPIGIAYLVWFVYLLRKQRYTRELLFFAIAQLPYLFLNIVAPFRGISDSMYVGYNFGLLTIPAGPLVPIVSGGMALLALFFLTKALLNEMDRWWILALGFMLFLAITVAIPILVSILNDPASFRLELGEYLQVSGYWVALIFLLILSLPTLYAVFISVKNLLKKRRLQHTQ